MYAVTTHDQFGAFNPIKAVKKAGKGVVKGVKKGAKVVSKPVAKIALVAIAPVAIAATLASKAAFQVLIKPIKVKLNEITEGRARKLAMDRRRSTTPTPTERAEARAWNKSQLKSKGPHGVILSLLAGSPEETALLGSYQLGAEPISTGTVAVLVPILKKLAVDTAVSMIKSGAIKAISPSTPQPEAPRPAPRKPPPPPVEEVEEEVAVEEIEGASLPSGSVGAGVVFAGLAVVTGLGIYWALK